MRGISEEWIRKTLETVRKDIDSPGMVHIEIALENLLLNCYELNNWKPINENTPKDRHILLLTDHDVAIEGYFMSPDVGYWIECVTFTVIYPTHWQELPPLPNEQP